MPRHRLHLANHPWYPKPGHLGRMSPRSVQAARFWMRAWQPENARRSGKIASGGHRPGSLRWPPERRSVIAAATGAARRVGFTHRSPDIRIIRPARSDTETRSIDGNTMATARPRQVVPFLPGQNTRQSGSVTPKAAIMPPFTRYSPPMTKLARSLARKAMSSATSAGLATRPRGCILPHSAMRA